MIYVIERIKFWWNADRLGPDIPITHCFSYFPKYYEYICKQKFREFGENSELRPNAYAIDCAGICIGDNVVIRHGCMMYGHNEYPLTIEDNVLLGPEVHIYSANHRYENRNVLISRQGHVAKGSVIIREGAWIGGKVTILPGVVIGKHSVIAAGSVVTKSVPDYTVFAGIPAKKIKEIV